MTLFRNKWNWHDEYEKLSKAWESQVDAWEKEAKASGISEKEYSSKSYDDEDLSGKK